MVAFALALVWARNLPRYGVLLLLGLVLVVAWFVAGVLTAPSDPNHVPNCSDCSYTWGRWWEPQLVVAVLILNLIAWVVGATLGWLLRRLVIRRRAAGYGAS